ncbi:MAG: TraU family protein [Pseudomonadota bacterium]
MRGPAGIRTWALAVVLSVTALPAQAVCQDELILSPRLITDICWDCIFPITVAGQTLAPFGTKPQSTDAAGQGANSADPVTSAICFCDDQFGVPMLGLTIGMWQPARIIELVRNPGCSPALGGIELPTVHRLRLGGAENETQDDEDSTFYYYHIWSFPLLDLLGLFSQDRCNQDGYLDIDALYLSELDPTWVNSTLALYANPESVLFANVAAVTSCIADAVASNAHRPIDAMFWCAGSWGTIYPITGSVLGPSDLPNQLSLLATRAIAANHRRGLARRTMGSDTLCNGLIDPFITKSMYRMSMWSPLPEAEDNHDIGESTFQWGLGRSIPGIGEDAVYVLWRWTDCCTAPR